MKSLQKGSESLNPTSDKRKQLFANLAGIIAGIVCFFIKTHWPDLDLFGLQDDLITIFISALGAVNYYFTTVSSKKVGLLG